MRRQPSDNELIALGLRAYAQDCDDIGARSRHAAEWQERARRCRELAERYTALATVEAEVLPPS